MIVARMEFTLEVFSCIYQVQQSTYLNRMVQD